MTRIKLFLSAILLITSVNVLAMAEGQSIIHFKSGDYQKILDKHADQAFVLVLWSVTCSSCIKEMDMLQEIHREQPGLEIVMLSTDDVSEVDEVNQLLAEKGIADLESWVFAESSSQRLRYEIDPEWYGEIPRIYFFDAQHQRQGFSGKMTKQEFISQLQ